MHFIVSNKEFFEILAYIAAISSVIILLMQIRSGQKRIEGELRRKNKENTLMLMDMFRDEIRTRHLYIRDSFNLSLGDVLSGEQAKLLRDNVELREKSLYILSKLERIGVGFKHGIYDGDILFDLNRSMLLNTFAFYYRYILISRDRIGTAYIEFEALCRYLVEKSEKQGLQLPIAFHCIADEWGK